MLSVEKSKSISYRPERAWSLILGLFFLCGCHRDTGQPRASMTGPMTHTPAEQTATPEPSSTTRPQPSATASVTPTRTRTPAATHRPTVTPRPTETLTATITPTPTFDFPSVTVQMQANCRYGPGTAYLYSHGLYQGDHGQVHGRNFNASWLWIQPENLDRHCWVSASVVQVMGDIFTVVVHQSRLPYTTFIGPPKNVKAERTGDQVTVTWSPVKVIPPEDGRGYLLEVTVCQNDNLLQIAAQTDGSSYTFTDESGCSGGGGGKLYAVEKHGYTDPVDIPWP